MPLYEYICQVCGQHFDARQGFDDPPLTDCPAGHQGVRRLVGQPVVHFHGKGFYVTDSKKARHAGSR